MIKPNFAMIRGQLHRLASVCRDSGAVSLTEPVTGMELAQANLPERVLLYFAADAVAQIASPAGPVSVVN
ncbi:MAG: hypothetical protein MJY68_06830 [Bacteroidaceae bacterium]|nr:hypothetical protein [Bacteroidaceae bacterium]